MTKQWQVTDVNSVKRTVDSFLERVNAA